MTRSIRSLVKGSYTDMMSSMCQRSSQLLDHSVGAAQVSVTGRQKIITNRGPGTSRSSATIDDWSPRLLIGYRSLIAIGFQLRNVH